MEAMQAAALTHYNQSWEHVCGGTAAIGIAHSHVHEGKKQCKRVIAFQTHVLVKLIFIGNSGILEFHCFSCTILRFLGCLAFRNMLCQNSRKKHPKCTSSVYFICIYSLQLHLVSITESLKAVFSKWVFFSLAVHKKSPLQLHLHIPNFTVVFLSILWRFSQRGLFMSVARFDNISFWKTWFFFFLAIDTVFHGSTRTR